MQLRVSNDYKSIKKTHHRNKGLPFKWYRKFYLPPGPLLFHFLCVCWEDWYLKDVKTHLHTHLELVKRFFLWKSFFYEGIKGYSPSIRIHLQDSAIFLAKVDLPTPCQEVEYRGIEALEKKYLLVFGYALVELWWGLSAWCLWLWSAA